MLTIAIRLNVRVNSWKCLIALTRQIMNTTEQVFLRICMWSCETDLLMVSNWFAVGVEYSCVFLYLHSVFVSFVQTNLKRSECCYWSCEEDSLSRRIGPCIVRLLNTPPSVGIAACNGYQGAVVRISGTIAESHWVKTLYPSIHGTSFNTSSTN